MSLVKEVWNINSLECHDWVPCILIQVLELPRRDKTRYTVNIVSSQLSAWALIKFFARLFEGSAYEKIARDKRMIPLILRYILHL